jgi:hypothetical protein
MVPDKAQVCGHCGEDLEIPYNPELDMLWEEDSFSGSHVEVRPGGHQQSEVYTSARQTNEQPAGQPLPPLHLDEPVHAPPPPPQSSPPPPQAEPQARAPRPAPQPIPPQQVAPEAPQAPPPPEAPPSAAPAPPESGPEPKPARPAFGAQAEIATNILNAEPGPEPGPEPEPEPEPARPAFGGQANIATHIVDTDPEKDRNTKIVDVSVPAMVRRAKQDKPQEPLPTRKAHGDAPKSAEPLEDLSKKVRLFYARMHRVDRLTFWITLLTFISAFLPWRNVLGRGLVSGIEGLGGASAGGALLVGLCIYSRTVRRRLAGLVLFLQLIAAAAIVAAPVYIFFYQRAPGVHIGFVATALGGAAIVILTFARMAVRSF